MDVKEWQQQTEALKKIAEIVEKTPGLRWGLIEFGKYRCKVSPVLIEGSLKFEQWEDDAGVSWNRLRVRLQHFEFLGFPGENTEQVENAESAENTQKSDNAEQVSQVNESAAVPF